jgi:hypothetical protein
MENLRLRMNAEFHIMKKFTQTGVYPQLEFIVNSFYNKHFARLFNLLKPNGYVTHQQV